LRAHDGSHSAKQCWNQKDFPHTTSGERSGDFGRPADRVQFCMASGEAQEGLAVATTSAETGLLYGSVNAVA